MTHSRVEDNHVEINSAILNKQATQKKRNIQKLKKEKERKKSPSRRSRQHIVHVWPAFRLERHTKRNTIWIISVFVFFLVHLLKSKPAFSRRPTI